MEVNTLNRTSRCQIIGGNQQKFFQEYQERIQAKGDLTLKVNDESTQVHRAVLMEKSDYFKSMFSGQFSESSTACIDLSHCFSNIEELNVVVDYMYTEKVLLTRENITLMVNSASLFLLTDLVLACSEYLMANLAPCTCISIFILAEKYSLEKVQHGCLEIFKAWFPFYICHLKEALDIPPDCMKVLVEENVFELIAEDVRVTFLKKWCEHLGETTGGAVPVPGDVQRLIQKDDSTTPAGNSADTTKTPSKDEMQEVFMAIFYPEGSGQIIRTNDLGPDVRTIEILAFTPKLKTWKSLLRHTFSEPIHPKFITNLIGLTETKAFFEFGPESRKNCERRGGESRMEKCIVSVDLESGTECLITVPYKSFKLFSTTCFLWGTDLYGLFLIKDECCWSLFKNQHNSECDGNCKGECWKYVCDLTIDRVEEGDSIIAKAFGNDVFIGLENFEFTEELIFFHMYKNAAGKCRIVELAPWGRFEDFQFEYCALFSCIYVDYETSLVKFVLKLDAGECILDFAIFPDLFHNQYTCTYDVEGKKWKDKEVEKVVYPKELPKALEVTRKIRKVDGPEEDFLEEASIHWYFARSTSPYNSSIWRAGKDGKFEIVSHAPCALSTIARMTTGQLRTGFLSEMPNATMKDFSGDLGQSALTTLVVEEAEVDFQLSFKAKKNKKLLNLRKWENTSAELWEKNLENEETDCHEILPEGVDSS